MSGRRFGGPEEQRLFPRGDLENDLSGVALSSLISHHHSDRDGAACPAGDLEKSLTLLSGAAQDRPPRGQILLNGKGITNQTSIVATGATVDCYLYWGINVDESFIRKLKLSGFPEAVSEHCCRWLIRAKRPILAEQERERVGLGSE